MKELIPIHHTIVKNETVPTVIGRELHQFMAIGRDFPTWITGRIDYVGYEEGRDFVKGSSPVLGKNPNGGRPRVEYYLTLDMAKELCMMERNEMGRLARKYFIRCEKEAKKAGADAAILRETLLNRTPEWKRIARYRAKGLSHQDIGALVGISKDAVGKALAEMTACRVVTDDKALPALTSRTVVKHMVKALPRPGQEACGTRLNRTAAKELLAARPQWVKMLRYRGMDLNYTEIGTLCRVSRTTVGDTIRRMADCGLVDLSRDLPLFPASPEARA
jgi:anti-repressor protein